MAARRSGLGKGLGALIPQAPGEGNVSRETLDLRDRTFLEVTVGSIHPNSYQPRQKINEEELSPLVNSVRELGVLQPLLVRRRTANSYELIAGERRWRAAKLAGLKTVPVVVKDVKDEQSLEQAIVENLHRKDLNVLDEAMAYQQLMSDFSLTQDNVAKRVGKSRSAIANALRVLQLPEQVRKLLSEERLTAGHAVALLVVEEESQCVALGERVAKEALSVRETEALAKALSPSKTKKSATPSTQSRKASSLDAASLEVRDQLSDYLSTRVGIKRSGKGGKIVVEFADDRDLVRILDAIMSVEAVAQGG